MKTIIKVLALALLLISCEDDCKDRIAEITTRYTSYIEQAEGNPVQQELLLRELNAKIARACD